MIAGALSPTLFLSKRYSGEVSDKDSDHDP